MQKKIVRILANAKYNDHTNPLFLNLNLLKFEDIYNAEAMQFIYKFKTNILPTALMKLFVPNYKVHERQTRQSNDFYGKKCRTTLAKRHITCKGPATWNNLPKEIKMLRNISMNRFSNIVRKYFIGQYAQV